VPCRGACSGPAEPPMGAFGLRFGDVPPAGLPALRTPLPDALAQRLRFYALPGRIDALGGVALADPVLAFHDGRLFSIAAAVAAGDDGPQPRQRLAAAFGTPYCQGPAGASACLWRVGAVDIVFEETGGGPSRLMLRHRPMAGAVAAVRDDGLPLQDARDASRLEDGAGP